MKGVMYSFLIFVLGVAGPHTPSADRIQEREEGDQDLSVTRNAPSESRIGAGGRLLMLGGKIAGDVVWSMQRLGFGASCLN